MRPVAVIAVASGRVWLALAAAAPSLVEWQLSSALRHYGGSPQQAAEIVAAELSAVQLDRIPAALLGSCAIVAGCLISLRRRIGVPLLLATAAACVTIAVVGAMSTQGASFLGAAVGAAWWLFVGAFTWQRSRDHGSTWWPA
jgi:hypothetical protein